MDHLLQPVSTPEILPLHTPAQYPDLLASSHFHQESPFQPKIVIFKHPLFFFPLICLPNHPLFTNLVSQLYLLVDVGIQIFTSPVLMYFVFHTNFINLFAKFLRRTTVHSLGTDHQGLGSSGSKTRALGNPSGLLWLCLLDRSPLSCL